LDIESIKPGRGRGFFFLKKNKNTVPGQEAKRTFRLHGRKAFCGQEKILVTGHGLKITAAAEKGGK